MENSVLKRMVIIIPIVIVGILIFAWIVLLLWNNVVSPVLHISAISFRQALGILILAKILFGGFTGGSSSAYYRKQRMMWNIMTPEQKEKFRREWKNRTWFYCSKNLEMESNQ